MPLNWENAASLVMQELRSQSDRVVAIVGGAMVDDCLIAALSKKLNTRLKTDAEANEALKFLFSTGDGPLASTIARRSLAYLQGMIGPETLSDLGYIAKIRNKFAHWVLAPDSRHVVQALTFEDQQIASWIQLLNAPKRSLIDLDYGRKGRRKVAFPKGQSLRMKFTRAIIAIWLGLELSNSDSVTNKYMLLH